MTTLYCRRSNCPYCKNKQCLKGTVVLDENGMCPIIWRHGQPRIVRPAECLQPEDKVYEVKEEAVESPSDTSPEDRINDTAAFKNEQSGTQKNDETDATNEENNQDGSTSECGKFVENITN